MTAVLGSTRWWLSIALPSLSITWTIVNAARVWGDLTGLEQALIVSSAVALVTAIVARDDRALALVVLAYLLLVACAFIGPPDQVPWLVMPNLVGNAAYIAIMLAPRRIGFVFPFIAAAIFAAILSRRPSDVIMWAPTDATGWIVVGQVFWACGALWWTWNRLVDDAADGDAAFHSTRERIRSSIEARERDEAWRSAAVRVHESILNTIRYVLTADRIDRSGLIRLLQHSEASEPLPAELVQRTMLVSIFTEAIDRALLPPNVRVEAQALPIGLDGPSRMAVLEALVELLRNSAAHGHALTVHIRARRQGNGPLVIEVTDDGDGMSSAARRGFGLDRVVGDGLASVGARWDLVSTGAGTKTTITVPLGLAHVTPGFTRRESDYARIAVSAVLAGTITIGIAWFIVVAASDTSRSGLAAILGVLGVVGALAVFARHQRVSGLATVAVASLSVGATVLLALGISGCASVEVSSAVLNTTGFAVVLVAVWGTTSAGVLSVAAWSLSAVLLMSRLDDGCRAPAVLAVTNSLVTVPVLLLTSYFAARVLRRAQQRTFEAEIQEAGETARALASRLFAERLSTSVAEAGAVLELISSGSADELGARRSLLVLDARIRMLMQCEPGQDGAIMRLAGRMIDVAVHAGVVVNVRSLSGSKDDSALPQCLEDALLSLLEGIPGATVVVQAFYDDEHDYLSVTLDDMPSGLGDRLADCVAGTTTAVDVVDNQIGPAVILVSRRHSLG